MFEKGVSADQLLRTDDGPTQVADGAIVPDDLRERRLVEEPIGLSRARDPMVVVPLQQVAPLV